MKQWFAVRWAAVIMAIAMLALFIALLFVKTNRTVRLPHNEKAVTTFHRKQLMELSWWDQQNRLKLRMMIDRCSTCESYSFYDGADKKLGEFVFQGGNTVSSSMLQGGLTLTGDWRSTHDGKVLTRSWYYQENSVFNEIQTFDKSARLVKIEYYGPYGVDL